MYLREKELSKSMLKVFKGEMTDVANIANY